MEDDISKDAEPQEQMAAAAIPDFCPNDGTILIEGTRFGFNAWVCPDCTYWKIRP